MKKNSLLGSTYHSNSILNFGANNKSDHIGLSTLLKVLPQNKLLLEAALSKTAGNSCAGIFSRTSAIQSQSIGLGLMHNALFQSNDSLVISLKQPLRIASGQVGILMPSLDKQGFPLFNTEYVNLRPNGREVDYKIAYDRPIGNMLALSLQAAFYKDVLNVKGKNNANIGLLLKTNA